MKPHSPENTLLSSVSADLVDYSPRGAVVINYSICGMIAAAIAWSCLTRVLEVAPAVGTVLPEQHVQVVQSLEGGAVQKIFARSGDHVRAGDVLVELDPTSPGSSRNEIAAQVAGLSATSIRLNALLQGIQPVFPEELRRSYPALVDQSLQQYDAAQKELASALATLDEQIIQRSIELSESKARLATGAEALRLTEKDLKALQKLQRAKAAGRSEVLNAQSRFNDIKGQNEQLALSLHRIEAAIAELKNQRAERVSAFSSRTGDALADTQVKMSALGATLAAQQRRVDQTTIRASSSGVVKTIRATSVGQVIRPGEEVAEIVPDDNKLFVQAKVRPEDIAFLHEGMPALVKLSAYDYSIFGAIDGSLKRIAADSTTDDRGQIYYLVDIQLPQTTITRRGEQWPIKSGMVANVEIVTGKRSVFQYLTKPIHRMATMALKER